MNIEMDDLKKKWKDARKATTEPASAEQIISKAAAKKKWNLNFHYGNIVVLTLLLIALCFFFYYLFRFQNPLSKAGVLLMTGGIAVRILVEVVSSIKFRRIDLSHDTLQTTKETVQFYLFRKKVHGPVTISIVALYIIGFFMLTPEFSKYIKLTWMVLMDGAAAVSAVFIVYQVRKSIRKEMDDLLEVMQLKNELNEAEKT